MIKINHAIVFGLFMAFIFASGASASEVKVYKSPYCGDLPPKKWSRYYVSILDQTKGVKLWAESDLHRRISLESYERPRYY